MRQFRKVGLTDRFDWSFKDVLKFLQQHYHISFEKAALKFYKSETYKTLQETENGLWAESAEYIADGYYEEAREFKFLIMEIYRGNLYDQKERSTGVWIIISEYI